MSGLFRIPRASSDKRGVFVISYRRANKVKTWSMLRRFHYTGDKFVVAARDDPELEEYRRLFRDDLIEYNRELVDCDYCDNLPRDNTYPSPLAVRNVLWDVAAELGWTHFLVLDDDYSHILGSLAWRVASHERSLVASLQKFPNYLDRLFAIFWDFLDDCPNVMCVCMAQTGEVANNEFRKVMQTFFLRTDRRFDFVGRGNDDVSTYYVHGLRGKLFLQNYTCVVKQMMTQTNPGGLTDYYRIFGTYAKSFYTFMQWPGNCRVSFVSFVNRLHHSIFQHSYPEILRSAYA